MAGSSQAFDRIYKNTSSTTEDLPGASTAYTFAFVADDTAATFNSFTTTQSFDGALAAVGAKFGDPAPNSLTITITDVVGIPVATGTITASGYISLDRPMFFVPGPLTIALTGNATNSAEATVALVFA